ncbi:hypothetical protein D9V84_09960 [Bacteroidetes/Chlorobi group bacterium Naka2016]|nr:MAG: hypothetical protein D9V84_09960 [Bacteroidetes/Chlorobi group bacterium Naka2016]
MATHVTNPNSPLQEGKWCCSETFPLSSSYFLHLCFLRVHGMIPLLYGGNLSTGMYFVVMQGMN